MSQIGPFPPPERGGARECSNCGLITGPDSQFCAYCGEHLGSASGYQQRDGDTILCHVCESLNQETALYCRVCGHSVPPQAYKELKVAEWSTPTVNVSSNGRDGTDPYSRARYLASLDDSAKAEVEDSDDGGELFRRIDRAERALARAEEDHYQAAGEAQAARANYPETDLPGSSLSPSARTRFLNWREAEARELRTSRARDAARASLDRLLAEYETLSSPTLGLRPGPLSDDSDNLDDGSVAWAERAAERARKRRLR